MSFEKSSDLNSEQRQSAQEQGEVMTGIQVQPEVIAIEGVSSVSVPGENGEPGARFWISNNPQ